MCENVTQKQTSKSIHITHPQTTL